MKKSKYLLIIVFFILSLSLLGVEPVSYKKKIKLVSGEEDKSQWRYYSFDENRSLKFEVSGEKRYKLILRASEVTDDVELYAEIDGNRIKSYTFKEDLSSKTHIKGETKTVTKGKIIYFKIPRGLHTIEIFTEKELYGRLLITEGHNVSIAPVSFADEDMLIVKDEEYEYFFTSTNHPAEYVLIGPAKVTIYTRLAYFSDMTGVQDFEYTIDLNGERENYSVKTEQSDRAYYKTHKSVIPSKANKEVINIPKGKNNIKIWGDNVAVKLYIPKSKLKNDM